MTHDKLDRIADRVKLQGIYHRADLNPETLRRKRSEPRQPFTFTQRKALRVALEELRSDIDNILRTPV